MPLFICLSDSGDLITKSKSSTRGKRPCELPWFREQEIVERFGQVLRDVTIPADVARDIEAAFQREHAKAGKQQGQQRARLARALDTLRGRMDAAYVDKLDGKISEDFWHRKQTEWEGEEARLKSQIALQNDAQNTDRLFSVHRVLELAQNAHSLYVTRKPAEQAELVRNTLSNCSIDAVSLYPTYTLPFDLIAKRAKNQEWSGREDSNLRPPGPEPGALPVDRRPGELLLHLLPNLRDSECPVLRGARGLLRCRSALPDKRSASSRSRLPANGGGGALPTYGSRRDCPF